MQEIIEAIIVVIITVLMWVLFEIGLHKLRFSFINSRKQYRARPKQSTSNYWANAAKTFGVKAEELKRMSKEEIKKMYRNLSKVHHPDVGGNEQDFINLQNAYEFAYAHAN